ncbi:MAG: hypothetical protein KBT36_07780 [Kurthia sp.]|nr:hypothetical protein [Candidatus Kurthia equi]
MEFITYPKDYNPYIQQYLLTDDQLLYMINPQAIMDESDEERRTILAFDDELFVRFLFCVREVNQI